VNVVSVRRFDEAREVGRKSLREETKSDQKRHNVGRESVTTRPEQTLTY